MNEQIKALAIRYDLYMHFDYVPNFKKEKDDPFFREWIDNYGYELIKKSCETKSNHRTAFGRLLKLAKENREYPLFKKWEPLEDLENMEIDSYCVFSFVQDILKEIKENKWNYHQKKLWIVY